MKAVVRRGVRKAKVCGHRRYPGGLLGTP
jgi:hypothetical protein